MLASTLSSAYLLPPRDSFHAATSTEVLVTLSPHSPHSPSSSSWWGCRSILRDSSVIAYLHESTNKIGNSSYGRTIPSLLHTSRPGSVFHHEYGSPVPAIEIIYCGDFVSTCSNIQFAISLLLFSLSSASSTQPATSTPVGPSVIPSS